MPEFALAEVKGLGRAREKPTRTGSAPRDARQGRGVGVLPAGGRKVRGQGVSLGWRQAGARRTNRR